MAVRAKNIRFILPNFLDIPVAVRIITQFGDFKSRLKMKGRLPKMRREKTRIQSLEAYFSISVYTDRIADF